MEYIKKRPNYINWLFSKPNTAGFLVCLILSIGVLYTMVQRLEIIKENEHKEMNKILFGATHNIEQCLKNSYTASLTLALTINDSGIPENFEVISSKLLEANNCISTVQMVPNGIIKYIYPIKKNESAMNLNLFSSPTLKREALKSAISKKMYFAGPFKLKQGGLAIVGRLPVYKKNKFWGFSAVIIKLEKLLKVSGITTVDKNKYYFQFSKRNPNTQKKEYFIRSKSDFYKNYYISSFIPDGNWTLYLIEKKHNYIYSTLMIPTILGLLLAILFGAFITILLKKPKKLEQLINDQGTKLLNSETKFKTIFDQAPLGIALVDDASGNFLEINNKFCELIGFTEEEMKLKNYQSITYSKDLTITDLKANELSKGKINSYSAKKRYVTRLGKVIWVNLIVSTLTKSNNESSTNIKIVEDISLQKQILENLKESEKQFKNLFKNSPIPLWEVDMSLVKNYLSELNLHEKDTIFVEKYLISHPEVIHKCFNLVKVIAVNYECLKILKIKTKKELISNLDQILDIESIDDFIKQLVAVVQNNKQLTYDSKIKNNEGQCIDIHFRWNVIRGYEKTFERVIISTENITFRKKNERLILESRQKLESLINTIDGVVWERDIATFDFTFVSKKVEQILGYKSDEWLMDSDLWKNHIHPEDRDRVLDFYFSKTKGVLAHVIEYRIIAKNGTAIFLKDIVNVIYKDGKALSLHGITIDITKSKNAEHDLNNSFDLVSKQNERLLNFSYIISHNLRSHTSNIASIVTLLQDSKTEKEKREMMELLVSVSHLLDETMQHLNEIINIRNNVNLLTEQLNLKEYADNVMKVFSKQIISKQVTIYNNIPNNLMINYNPAYLESVLYNIISNAIRYSHPERKTIIDITLLNKKNKKVLQISDNGVGIDLEKNGNKIFGMYKTFSNDPTSKGIGLFITKNQIEAMGGTIMIESEINMGTTFKIELL